jgi:K(+)-stimulated pyrophosphate-energized sodium pump
VFRRGRGVRHRHLRWLLALSPGNSEMQEISLAVQDGAKAYLRRQYTIIAGVAVVLAIVLAVGARGPGRRGHPCRDRLPDRRDLLGRGRIHRHERVRARERARGRVGSLRRLAALEVAFKGGAVTGMLVAGSRCSAWPATTGS